MSAAMSEELKRVRKGTKSCTECRRRKVRCTWSSDESPRCRRCEERNTNCVAQIYSLHSPGRRKLSSRDRIARLEQQLTTLTKALSAEDRNHEQTVGLLETISSHHEEGDTGTDDSSESEGSGLVREPTHLHSLFDNDLISTDTSRKDAHEAQRSKALTELSTSVRLKLQELIPPKQEVDTIASFATQWLSLFHALFPAPSMIKSGEEMVARYEAVKSSNVDPAFLASWLMSLAMTIYQVPKDGLGPEHQLKGFRNPQQFSRSVSDAVEMTIMRHEALLGTIQGIDSAMLFLRLQLSRGNFKKTWLMLRRVIAVAELIGLHRAARRPDSIHNNPEGASPWSDPTESNARKAQVWESLCSVDRISGMMFNLPPGTRRYRLPLSSNIIVNGEIALRAYLCSLSEIAMKVQDMDDLDLCDHADTETYATVLKIDGELRILSSLAPNSWWNTPSSLHLSEQLLQYWHFYITLRVHLPFTLRHDTGEQFSFSRLACLKACLTLIDRYRNMRKQLPSGFFLCRIVDLQVFTALVVLVLAYHAASSMERMSLHAQTPYPPEILIPEALEFMKTILDDPVSHFARQAVDAVTALTQLLEVDKGNLPAKDLKLKVPLLGKLHVRRKQEEIKSPNQQQPATAVGMDAQQNLVPIQPQAQFFSNNMSGYTANNVPVNNAPTQFPWDPLSWSIEDDQAGVFQEGFMTDDYSPFGSWWDPMNNEYGVSGTTLS